MDILALYELASQQNIDVLQYPMSENGSVSVLMPDGTCIIGMDQSVLDDHTQERVHLCHELGHCITGSFYNQHSSFDCRRRHENRADKWAVQKLIPIDELDQAVADGRYRNP